MVRIIVLLFSLVHFQVLANQDPTAPLGWLAPKVSTTAKRPVKKVAVPTLQSIVCENDAQCYAIINDRVVEDGDRVNGYTTSQVTPEYVVIRKGAKQWKLELFTAKIKH
ncbi:MSHA biogenesis protein MshK [Vibrio tapetis]|uniref:MSHA biogenesis protein MshK n=1 Tax=Vibrio tapetis subsp. tapetis TaxID=1671868 RepID=A0A2N8ZFK1_9VIBR|nr:MSHA biogenesis protein MshK [Vibrio tapetis]SON50689.1 MSHA biogenesis protein MshK [Vibrio tapetis subsp. tapetis]